MTGTDPDAISGMDSFVLRITLGNDAMQDAEDVSRALKKVAVQVVCDGLERGRQILDENGSTVGSWLVT